MGKLNWLAGTALAASMIIAGSAAYAAPSKGPSSSAPSNAELQQEIDNLELQMQQGQMSSQQTINDLNSQLAKVGSGTGWWSNTSISGRMYYDASWVQDKSDGTKLANDNGYGFDIKRFYIGVDHKFNDTYSANITTDFTYASKSTETNTTQLYIKKAYLQAKVSDALVLRFGSTDMPWIPFVEDVYGYRFIENTLIDRTGFGTSADWGVHASGKFADGMINYALSVVNGAGYKKPPGAGNQQKFNTVDVEGRVNLKLDDFTLAVGGYTGKLGFDTEGATTYHTANRINALAAYTNSAIRLGIEYFYANDWGKGPVTTTTGDKAQGFSGFASYQFNPMWSVFGRYDYVQPNKDTNSHLKDNYFNVGIDFTPTKIVDFALVYKRDKADHGIISTSNGPIGGVNDGTYDEVGIFSQFRW